MTFFKVRINREQTERYATVIRQPDYSGQVVVMYSCGCGEGVKIDLVGGSEFQASVIAEVDQVPKSLYERAERLLQFFGKEIWVGYDWPK